MPCTTVRDACLGGIESILTTRGRHLNNPWKASEQVVQGIRTKIFQLSMTGDRGTVILYYSYAYRGYNIYTRRCVRGTREVFMFFAVTPVTRHCRITCFKERRCKDTTILGEIQIFSWCFVVLSLIYRIFGFAEDRLHLKNIQINLVFYSICTIFVPRINNKKNYG